MPTLALATNLIELLPSCKIASTAVGNNNIMEVSHKLVVEAGHDCLEVISMLEKPKKSKLLVLEATVY